MSLTVSNMLNETLRLIKLLQNGLYNLNVLSLIVTANIVNLAYLAISDNKINSRTMVLYIKPVTNINTLTIYRQFLIMQSIDNHERNQLLRKMIWAIVIAAAGNSYRQAISTMIRHYQ